MLRYYYGLIRNFLLLFNVSLGMVTVTKPVVAPAGTVASIKELNTTVNVAAVPLKLLPFTPLQFAYGNSLKTQRAGQ